MSRPRAVHQLSASAAFGDAIGNELFQIRDVLRAAGYESDIFVEFVDPRTASQVRPYQEYLELSSPDNIVLLHYSIGSAVSAMARELPDRRVLIYHNVTPAEWFAPYSFQVARGCADGRLELASLAECCELGLGDSDYNRRELEELGFKSTGVLPLLLEMRAFDRPLDPIVMERFDDGRTNLLFVGRVVPNKCFEDLLRLIAYYQMAIDHRARLVIVGENLTSPPYYHALQDLAARLQLHGVHFSGQVTQAELNAYYRTASAFVCMSEHEGYCVPLFEAMHCGLPVFAFDAAAIPSSTGEGVVLLHDKDPAFAAETIAAVLSDPQLKERILARQQQALETVSRDRVAELLLEYVRRLEGD